MEQTWQQELRQASTPVDVATIALNRAVAPQRRRSYTVNLDNGQSTNTVQSLNSNQGGLLMCVMCIVCIIVFGQLAAFVYGAVVGSTHTNKQDDFKGNDNDACIAGGNWILIMSMVGLFQMIVCGSVQQEIKKTDPLMEGGVGKLVNQINQLISLFMCCWMFYGCSIFFEKDIQFYCAKEMWNFGYIYVIVWLSLFGTAVLCIFCAIANNK